MQHFLAGHQQFHLCWVKYLLWSCSELHKGRQDIPSSLCPCVSKQGHTMPRTHSRSGFPFTPLKRGGGEKNFAKEFVGHSLLLLFPPSPPLPSYLKHSQTLENISLASFSQLAPSWQFSTRLTQPLSLSTVIKHSFPIGTHPHAALLYLQQECSHQGRPWGLPD